MSAAVAFAISAQGCDDRACFEWAEAVGPCPSQTAAPQYFGDCSDVTAVKSGPTFIDDLGGLCCYDVTHNDNHFIPCSDTTTTGQRTTTTVGTTGDSTASGSTTTTPSTTGTRTSTFSSSSDGGGTTN
jgi:hypothetical protein